MVYGCWADLMGTRSEPDQQVFLDLGAATDSSKAMADAHPTPILGQSMYKNNKF
jgi:hypothetical protein